jgi:hypothetical protein
MKNKAKVRIFCEIQKNIISLHFDIIGIIMSPTFLNEKGYRFSTRRTSVSVRSIMPDGIFISVLGRDYYLSFDRLPWFRNAKVSDIMNVSMVGTIGIRWDNLDVDLEIDSLIYPERYPLIMKRTIDEVF